MSTWFSALLQQTKSNNQELEQALHELQNFFLSLKENFEKVKEPLLGLGI